MNLSKKKWQKTKKIVILSTVSSTIREPRVRVLSAQIKMKKQNK